MVEVGGVLFLNFATFYSRCPTHESRKVTLQVMMERANCFAA